MLEHMKLLYNFGVPPLAAQVVDFRKQLEELGIDDAFVESNGFCKWGERK